MRLPGFTATASLSGTSGQYNTLGGSTRSQGIVQPALSLSGPGACYVRCVRHCAPWDGSCSRDCMYACYPM